LCVNANYLAVYPLKKHTIDNARAGGKDNANNSGGILDEALIRGKIIENGKKFKGGGGYGGATE